MKVDIPEDLQAFVEEEFATGHYPTKEDVVVFALRRLWTERQEAIFGIKAGLEDAAAGRVEPLEKVFGDLREEPGASET